MRLLEAGLGRGDLVIVVGERPGAALPDLLGTWLAGCIAHLTSSLAADRGGEDGAELCPTVRDGEVSYVAASRLIGAVRAELRSRREHGTLPDDACYVAVTSGSTSTSRAILGSARSLLAFLEWESSTLEVGPADRIGAVTSGSFDVAYRELLLPLRSGAALVTPPSDLRGRDAVDWLIAENVTILHAVPSIAEAWLRRAGGRGARMPLRWTIFAGEPLRGSVTAAWRERCVEGARVCNLYGPSETTLARFCHVLTGLEDGNGILPVGHALPGTSVGIVDESGFALPPGSPGRIVIVTSDGSYGYVGTPGADPAAPMSRSMRYETSDLGVVDERNGGLTVLGRLDNRLKRNGVWVDTDAVANLVEGLYPDTSCVVLVDRGPRGPRLAVFVAFALPIDAELIRREVLARLGPAHVPNSVVGVAEWPRLPSGKIDRLGLLRRHTGGGSPADPTAEAMVELGDVVTAVLGNRVHRNDSLIEKGLDAYGAELISEFVEGRFEIEFTAGAVLSARTLHGLDERIQAARPESGLPTDIQ
ncbi:AMP-binding protein [Nocardia sp. NPDC051929]|uniref:AMP-binding protein n=1 Tax=Nocardia sp. NPDC051929 TaxID=3364327 RepID=UPI0037CC729E